MPALQTGIAVSPSELLPGASDVVAHRHEKHDREPEDRADDDELRALGAVFTVHEEKDDERRLECGDHERDDDIEPVEIGVEIDLGRFYRQKRANHQRRKDRYIDLRRDYVVLGMGVG